MDVLLVIDMQNDFVDGALGTKEAQAIVPYVVKTVSQFQGTVLFTRDTHNADYLQTAEGQKLPVPHCIKHTNGWELVPQLKSLCATTPLDKPSFGSMELANKLTTLHAVTPISSITLLGLCTDICVISNAMIVKAALPEVPLLVDAKGCAGVTPQTHETALSAMEMCQINVMR